MRLSLLDGVVCVKNIVGTRYSKCKSRPISGYADGACLVNLSTGVTARDSRLHGYSARPIHYDLFGYSSGRQDCVCPSG